MPDGTIPGRPAATRRRGGATDEAIYQAVYGAIVEQRLSPGTKLGEDQLGEVFGVSRTRVRKVLQRLGHEGVVTLLPNRGAFVASPSVQEARDVFAARRVVEAAVAAEAARAIVGTRLAGLDRHVAAERDALERGDRRAQIKLSGEFHLLLARAAGNEVLAGFLKELVSRTSLIIALYEVPGVPGCRPDQHAQLVEAIAAKDADRVAGLMVRHLAEIEARLNLDGRGGAPVDLREVFAHAAAHAAAPVAAGRGIRGRSGAAAGARRKG